MSSTSNPKVENNADEENKNKKKKVKKKIELFPPLPKRPDAPSISVQIDNSCVF